MERGTRSWKRGSSTKWCKTWNELEKKKLGAYREGALGGREAYTIKDVYVSF